jgi:pyruvate,orthophosphate dikinase
MASLGLPVPPGFTITTEVCSFFYGNGRTYPSDLKAEVDAALDAVARLTGKRFGDPKNPLLVSVRSGARASMPGMMDTVLNLGLNDETVAALAQAADPRFAWDSYRRFIQMYGNVVLGVDHHEFESILELEREKRRAAADTDLTADDWQKIVALYKQLVEDTLQQPFPQSPDEQLWGAVGRAGEPPSMCRRWFSAIWATHRRPASPSPAILRPARGRFMASSCSTHRVRMWSRASARRRT